MKKIIGLFTVCLLSACSASVEQQQQSINAAQSKLPEGCTIGYAGEVLVKGSIRPSRVFYTVCGKVVTTSDSHTVGSKSTRQQSTINITKVE